MKMQTLHAKSSGISGIKGNHRRDRSNHDLEGHDGTHILSEYINKKEDYENELSLINSDAVIKQEDGLIQINPEALKGKTAFDVIKEESNLLPKIQIDNG